MVFPETDESVRLTGRPVLVVEVLSTGRGDDLVVKSGKYAAAGLGHWWVLDLRHGLLDAFVLAEHAGAAGGYQRATRLDATAQVGPATAVVSFGVAAAHVDLPQLLT